MQHLDACNQWALIVQSCNQSSGGNVYIYERENFKSYGAIVASMLDCVGSLLKILMMFVTMHQSHVATITESSVVPESGQRDDAQSFLEAVYRSQLINGLIEAFRSYGPNVSSAFVASTLSVLSELVLSSSKFLNQVSSLICCALSELMKVMFCTVR